MQLGFDVHNVVIPMELLHFLLPVVCHVRCNRMAAGHRQPTIQAVDVTRCWLSTKPGSVTVPDTCIK